MNHEDIKHLDLLSLCHYVMAGITGFFSCIPIIHLTVGLTMISQTHAHIAWLVVILSTTMILIGWTLTISMVLVARNLKQRQNLKFCQVIAAVECVIVPLGTLLGVLTLITLNKDSVIELFPKERRAIGS